MTPAPTTTPGRGPRSALTIAAALEPASLLILLINLATAHVSSIAAALGPIHGTAYLVTIVLAWSGDYSPRARLLALVPGLGGALALWASSTKPERTKKLS
jgi:hypothetical protein